MNGRRQLVLAFVIGAWVGSAAAQQPLGLEFQVNAYTTSGQQNVAVGRDQDGDFVVVWDSLGPDGNYAGIVGRRYHSNGTPLGAEFVINTTTASIQYGPRVSLDQDGDFVVVWVSFDQDGSQQGIFGQRYHSNGARRGDEFQVNSYTTQTQAAPGLALDADGDFVVGWQSSGQDGSFEGIFGQRYHSNGARAGGEFQVNSFTTQGQSYPSVAADADGDFVFAWQGVDQGGSLTRIDGQRFASSGVRQGGEFRISTYTTFSSMIRASVSRDADGDFVVVWESNVGQDGDGSGIFGQRFQNDGAPRGGEFQVNTYTLDFQRKPVVASDEEGNFVVVWQSAEQDGNNFGIFGRTYHSSGAAFGSEFQVNTYTPLQQDEPSVASDADGHFVVAWQSVIQDGDNLGVFAQRYARSPEDTPTATPTRTVSPTGTPGEGKPTDTPSPLQTPTATRTRTPTSVGSSTPTSSPIPTVPNGGALPRDEFQVNVQTLYSQFAPRVSSDVVGNFVVVWTSDVQPRSVRGRRYSAAATPLGTEFTISDQPAAESDFADVARATSGSFVVAWRYVAGFESGIRVRRFSSSGQPLGPSVLAGDGPVRGVVEVAIGSTGAFATVWTGFDADHEGVFLSLRDAAGQAVLTGFPVNSFPLGYQGQPDVVGDTEGNFAVVWASNNGSANGIFVRRFDALGEALDVQEFRVSSEDSGLATGPSVVAESEGGLFVTWTQADGLRGRRLEPDLASSGPETLLTQQMREGSLAADADGLALIGGIASDGSLAGVFGGFLSPAAGSLPSLLRLNVETEQAQEFLALTGHQHGRFVAVWESDQQDGDRKGIFGRLILASGAFRFDEAASQLTPLENAGMARVFVQRVGGSSGAVSVQYSTQDDTAQAGSDYGSVSGTLTWAEGDSAPKFFDVPILNDQNETEVEETLTLLLDSPTGDADVDDPGQVQLTIRDETNSYLRFVDPESLPLESGGPFTVQVLRESLGQQAVSVDFRTMQDVGPGAAQGGVSCTSGVDFVQASGTLSWLAGDLAPKSVVLTACDDFAAEGDESFTVLLENPSAGGVLSPPESTRVLLLDDSPGRLALSLDQLPQITWDQSNSLTLAVARIGGTEGPASVESEILFNTVPDLNLQVAESVLQWAPGEAQSKSFTVLKPLPAVRSGLREFRLTQASGAALDPIRARTAILISQEEIFIRGCPLGGAGLIVFDVLWLNLLVIPAFFAWNRFCMRSMRTRSMLGCAAVLLWTVQSEAGTYAFVSNGTTGSVSVMDLETGHLLGRLAGGVATAGLAVSPSGNRLYVADTGADSVRSIDTASGAVLTIPVGRRPLGLAVTPDGSRVYVANWQDGTVSVMNAASNTVLATVPVGSNPGALATDGQSVWVANFGSHELVLLDGSQNTVLRRIPVEGFPAGVAIGLDLQTLYVSNLLDDSVSVVDGKLGQAVARIPVGSAPRSVLLDPSRSRLYVGNSGDGSISVIDTSTRAVVRTIQAGPEMLSDLALSASGDRIYAVGLSSNRLLAFDPEDGALRESFPLGTKGHVALGDLVSLPSPPPVTPFVSVPRMGWWALALCIPMALWNFRRRRTALRSPQ